MNLIFYKIRITVQKLVLLGSCLLIWENSFSQNCPDLGNLTNYLFFFANGSIDANWQGATKGFAGNVAIDGIQAKERTSGGVPFAGTIYTNDGSLSNWSAIVSQNSGQATAATNQTSLIAGLEADLANAFAQINAMLPSPGYSSISSTSLNNLNTQNGVAETFVINITSGLSVSSKINITGDAGDCFVLRWDTDGNPNNGYQGQTKFQSGGAIVPKGALKPSNFINVAGDINSSGGGSNPPAPYPQGPRTNNGTGSLISNASNFNGGGFFTGYWLTTGKPTTGESSSLSNGIFVGGWYTIATKFSMTSGTSGVYVAPNTTVTGCLGDLVWNDLNQNGIKDDGETGVPDLTVHLRDCQNNLIRKTLTDAEGLYKFKDLSAGCYRVCVVLPDGFRFSPQNQGGNDTFDSDVATFNGCTVNIDLSPEENELTIDVGIFETDEIPCNCYGVKIAEIYMMYNGAPCSDGNNAQSGEAICSGSIGSTTNTFIKVGKTAGGSEWFTGALQQGQGFTIRSSYGGANQLDSDTYYTIGDQSGKFQTSCSKPIEIGDQFGGMQVLGIKFDDGTICGEMEESSAAMEALDTESLYFTAQKDGNDVSLYWVTNTGFKTDYFEVERSLDGVNFELMDKVLSTSDTEQMVNYQSRDEDAVMGINYYRLKLIFQDGSFRYSEIKEVTFHLDIKKFAVYPNPTADDFLVNLKEFAGNTGTVSVYTDLGQAVYKQHLEVITADPIRIDTDDLAPGVYAVTVQIEDKKAMTELLIVVKR